MERWPARLDFIDTVTRVGSWVVEYASGEYLLAKSKRNGGGIVFLRALHSTIVILSLALLLKNALDPTRSSEFSLFELQTQLSGIGPWFGTVFAATYAGLYSRFASQWSYLAGVYNQIKAAECRKDVDANCISQWKAGFIEDAEDLHLIRKPIFWGIAHVWLQDMLVCTAFAAHTPNGPARLAALRNSLGLRDSAGHRAVGVSERIPSDERENETPTRRAG
jgi:hypothetical protein